MFKVRQLASMTVMGPQLVVAVIKTEGRGGAQVTRLIR